jgi:alpha-D-ribose 1-methylphosphonate 5-triphosphate synthase subunit PhnH
MMLKGFDSEVFASQAVFRHLLMSMAYPGTIAELKLDLACPGRLSTAAGAVLLTLLDFETPLWTDLEPDSPELQWLTFHTGAPVTSDPAGAAFALVTDTDVLTGPGRFNPGTAACPDISTTLVIQAQAMGPGRHLCLTGPGIENEIFIHLAGIPEFFWENRAKTNQAYPAGIDMILVHEDRFCAIPRTTRIEVARTPMIRTAVGR